MRRQSEEFILDDMLTDHLRRGRAVRFVARGLSVWPSVLDGDQVTIAPPYGHPKVGQIMCVKLGSGFLLHRVIAVTSDGRVRTRGDALTAPD